MVPFVSTTRELLRMQIALSISEGLARNVLAAEVDGEVWDATRPIDERLARKITDLERQLKVNQPSGTHRPTCWPRLWRRCTRALNSVLVRP
jgi:hypothetical protein